MKVLITGITGFAGSHLADYILKNHPGVEIFGFKRWRSRDENIIHLMDKVKFVDVDVKDFTAVNRFIEEIKPDKIFHLAAQSFVPTSWKSPMETLDTNIAGEVNLFEAIRQHDMIDKTVIQIACSSEEYGLVHENEVPIRETNPLRPLSPYAVSKITQDYLAYQYHQSYGIKAIRTRTFNHTGPRRGEVFVISTFSKQIAMIENNLQNPVIKVGNLDAKRDFTDVRDVVRAYWLATEKCDAGDVYNIATGSTHTIQYVLDTLLAMSDTDIKVEQDPERMRPSDVQILMGDATKFMEKTGWKAEIPFEKTLEDTLNYWRKKIAAII